MHVRASACDAYILVSDVYLNAGKPQEVEDLKIKSEEIGQRIDV